MKIYNQIIAKCKEQRGVTAVVVAIAIAMLMGFVALAVDVGYVAATRNELQNVADSAALAGTGYIGNIYTGMTQAQMDAYDCSTASSPNDCASIIAQAQNVVGSGKNIAGGQDIGIDSGDVSIGKWNEGSPPTFTFTTNKPDAVKVTARRDSTAGGNGPISTFFAKIFGFNTVDVKADAIADLSGLSKIGPKGLPIPVGIAKKRFKDPFWCGQPIRFYPSNDISACGGWHTYDDDKGKIKVEILPGLIDGTFDSPETESGDIYFFNGGVNDAAYELLLQLFDQNKVLNDGIIDNDTDPTTWTTTVVVYDWDNCNNPNKPIKIIGFAEIVIHEICTAQHPGSCASGVKEIVADVSCDYIKPQRGGGGEFGIIGAIPGLVE